jgi:lipopolysaccharide heptosyltransferase II
MNTFNKILVLRFSSIGDIVLASPLLRVLRARFPKSQIDFVARQEYAELVRSNQNINSIYEFDAKSGFQGLRVLGRTIREEHYDLIVDIHNSLRSRYLRSIAGARSVVVNKRLFARMMLVKFKKNLYGDQRSVSDRYIEAVRDLGVTNDGKGLELHIPDQIQFAVNSTIAPLRLNRFEKVIGLCPSARHATKRWPLERYQELGIKAAKNLDAKILVFGGSADLQLCQELSDGIARETGEDRITNFCARFSLMETASAMNFCDAIVSNDSGLMHIADAMHKNLVAIFGSTVKEFGFYPEAKGSSVMEVHGLGCRPCSHIGRSTCPEGHFKCMKEITIDNVYESMSRLLSTNHL